MASCKDCKHYPMCGFSKYTKTPEKCLDFWDVSDVVKVVRCKDCKFRKSTFNGDGYFCTVWDTDDYEEAYVKDNDFCSYGERRTDGR